MGDEKILLVDDEPNVLHGYKRQLRKHFQIETALGGARGLRAIRSAGPFAVIVSDMRMPEMDGIEFLSKARNLAPDSVRMILTGNAELDNAIKAINEGFIFRFLTKPCPPDLMARALQSGIKQYRLVNSENELLDQTLKGSIRMLTEILSIADGQSFGKAAKVRETARGIANQLKIKETWEIELAAMLGQIGQVTIPAEVVSKQRAGVPLSNEERSMLERVPEIGHSLLSHIPRLDGIAEIIRFQNKHYDGSGTPINGVAGEDIPVGARILKAAHDLWRIDETGNPKRQSLRKMREMDGVYDPEVLKAAYRHFHPDVLVEKKPDGGNVKQIMVDQLEVGDVLRSDLKTKAGKVLLSTGSRISGVRLEQVRNYAKMMDLVEPISVEHDVDPYGLWEA